MRRKIQVPGKIFMIASVMGTSSQQSLSSKALLLFKPAAFNQLEKFGSGLVIAVSHVRVSTSVTVATSTWRSGIVGVDEDLVEGGVVTCVVAIVSISSRCNTSRMGATMGRD